MQSPCNALLRGGTWSACGVDGQLVPYTPCSCCSARLPTATWVQRIGRAVSVPCIRLATVAGISLWSIHV